MTGVARHWRTVAVAAAAALSVALIGGTMTDIGPWYQALEKPPWQPPDWLFGPAWTVIFAFAAASGATAWKHARDARDRQTIIGLFALNGFLNVLWSLLFFRLHRPDWALIEVLVLWASILLLMAALFRFSRLASWLLLPYLLWVSFASALNWKVVQLNAPF